MTATVLIRCAAPMQSWGTRSRFTHRDTERHPTKSGVVGLAAAALGRKRSEPIDDLAGLAMSVRVDSPGRVEVDFQTALSVAKADGGSPGTVLSYRHYLADADFLVALEGDEQLCSAIHQALRAPRWPLFLGRKSYVPGKPVCVTDGLQASDARRALAKVEWPPVDTRALPLVVECAADEPGDVVNDAPVSFVHDRRVYRERRVRHETIERCGEEARVEEGRA